MSSVFSGAPGRKASIAQGQILQDGKNEAYGFLDQGQKNALSSLAGGYDGAYNALTSGTGMALNALGGNYQQALNTLGSQYENAQGFYAPLGASANAGYAAYGDASGANGAEGYYRAKQNFQTGPGYEFMRDQGTDQALRAANAAGMTASGNTINAVQDRASNLANQTWGDYVSRLSPYLSLAPQLAGAQAGLATDYGKTRAGMIDNYGRSQADLLSGQGRSLASLAQGLGSGEAGIYSGTAGNKANTAIGVADKLGDVVNKGMMAGQEASATRMNFGLNALGTGLKLAGLFA